MLLGDVERQRHTALLQRPYPMGYDDYRSRGSRRVTRSVPFLCRRA
jgi:hypothetical protein